MTSQQFILWLRGFTQGVHDFNITPKQWDDLKEQLNNVDDTPYVSDNFTIGPDGAYERDPNHFPFGTTNGTIFASYPSGSTVTYTTNGAPNWYATTIAKEKTLLND